MIGCRGADDGSDLKRSDEPLQQLQLSTHGRPAAPPHRLRMSFPRWICAQNLCRTVSNLFHLQTCIRRNCRPSSPQPPPPAVAAGGLPGVDGGPRRLQGMQQVSLHHRPCPSPFCVEENEDRENEKEEEDDDEEEYHDVDETSPDDVSSVASFDGQQMELSSLDEATWRRALAAERHKTKTSSCVSICRHLAHEVFYGSCIRHLCSSRISSAPAEDGIMASSYGPVETEHRQRAMSRRANADMKHPSIWKRYGMRICAEAFCKSHYGYELVACGISRCHGGK